MKKFFAIPAFLFLALNIYAQIKPIEIKTEVNTSDNNIYFTAINNSFNTYSVSMNITSSEGYRNPFSTNNFITVSRGPSSIGKLERIPNQSSYTYQYSYSYFIGQSLRNIPDTNFVYLLPASNGQLLKGSNNVQSIEKTLGQKVSSIYYGCFFSFELGDTVCAARSGVVYSVADETKEEEKTNQIYSASRNKLDIEQKDGTLAHYFFTAPIKMLVEAGDKVIAGQPLAIFSTPSDKLQMLFSINYLSEKPLRDYIFSNRDEEKMKRIYQYLPVKFYLDKDYTNFISETGKYKVLHPVNIVTQEMTKKELKKFNQ